MISRSERQYIIDKFAPVPGDAEETTNRMVAWSRNFFGDPLNRAHYWIRTNTIPDIHIGLYRALAEEDKFIAVTSPRGHGKTTIDSLIYPLYRIYYNLDPVIIIIGKVEGSAKRVLRNIKREISFNSKLIEIYGNLRPDKTKDSLWSMHEARTLNGIFIRSVGMMGDIRGSLDSMYRPTLIIIDDPQSKKTMREPATLEAHEEYFDSDVIYSLDEQYGKIRFIGNLLGEQCLLASVIKDKRFKVVRFSAIVDDCGQPCKTLRDVLTKGKSVWEEKFPVEDLKKEAKHLSDSGKFHVFLFERQNIISDKFSKNLRGYKFHNLTFKRQLDQNVLIGDEYPSPIRVNTYLAIDPAFANTKSSDERAMIVFCKGRILTSLDNGHPFMINMLWVLEYIYNHMQPDTIINKTIELHKRYYFSSVILEAISGAQILDILLQKAIMSDNFYSRFPFSPVAVKYQIANKKDRIFSGLQPRVKLGQIAIRENMAELRDEMDNFEMYQSPHLLDALEMGNRFSNECADTYMSFSQKSIRYRRDQKRARERINNKSNFYLAPRSIKLISGKVKKL